jgi:hypothetical protein
MTGRDLGALSGGGFTTGRLHEQGAHGPSRFSTAEQKAIIERIKSKLGDDPEKLAFCSVCSKHNSYSVSDGFIFLPLQYTTRALDYSASGMPCVALTCGNCGHTLFFNMLSLGLTPLVNREPRF